MTSTFKNAVNELMHSQLLSNISEIKVKKLSAVKNEEYLLIVDRYNLVAAFKKPRQNMNNIYIKFCIDIVIKGIQGFSKNFPEGSDLQEKALQILEFNRDLEAVILGLMLSYLQTGKIGMWSNSKNTKNPFDRSTSAAKAEFAAAKKLVRSDREWWSVNKDAATIKCAWLLNRSTTRSSDLFSSSENESDEDE